jgi:L-amino acid N-acyltransferase YncA
LRLNLIEPQGTQRKRKENAKKYLKYQLMNTSTADALVRDAEARDLGIILEIMNDAIMNTTSVYDYHPRNNEFVQQWFAKKQADHMPVIVCEADGDTVGYGSFGIFRPWDAYKYSVEHSVYVHKDHRGVGYGKMLLSRLISKAVQGGYRTMIGGIDANNVGSITLHQQFGFVEAGRLKQVGYKFENWLDLVFMQVMLDKINK